VPQVGGSHFRGVQRQRLEGAVEGLVRGWLAQRSGGETFTTFQRRLSDDELGALAGLEPAKKRLREEVAA
jgi:sulfite reductase beta subunit-like hemoprotein